MTMDTFDHTKPLDDDTTPIAASAADETPAAGPTHEPTPADCLTTPPTEDGLNHMGYFRRPAGEDQPAGSTIVIKSHATSDNLANHVKEGVMQFLGWAPAADAPAEGGTVAAKIEPAHTPDGWAGKTYDVPPAAEPEDDDKPFE